MKIISLFNNKGGVGKSTLGYHLGCALGEMGKKVLLVDLDPQCNLTIHGMFEEDLHEIWEAENDFIEDFEEATKKHGLTEIIKTPRSIHFLLKPAEDGLSEIEKYPPPYKLFENVDLIPGRLSIHKYENRIAERWSSIYQSDNLSIRTITNIRRICEKYCELYKYDYVIVDTSPSLGILNKNIISTVDGFLIPAQPDMFSLYGIRNIGSALELWKSEIDTIFTLISQDKRSRFPSKFVQFIGYTIYNAKRRANDTNPYNLANAHYTYVEKIPGAISNFIKPPNRIEISNIKDPIGGDSVMHSHNTFTSVAQALKCPMWMVPDEYSKFEHEKPEMLDQIVAEKPNQGHYRSYRNTKDNYITFAEDFIKRVEVL